MNELLTWDEILEENGIYRAVEDHSDGFERYAVVSTDGLDRGTEIKRGPTQFQNGVCYVGFRRQRPDVSPSLMTPNEFGGCNVEPIISIHEEGVMWEKCEHLDIRICLKTED